MKILYIIIGIIGLIIVNSCEKYHVNEYDDNGEYTLGGAPYSGFNLYKKRNQFQEKVDTVICVFFSGKSEQENDMYVENGHTYYRDMLFPLKDLNSDYRINNISENIAEEWLWDFGDGTNSTDRVAKHTYSNEGSFAIKLTVKNRFGSNTTEAWFTVYNNKPSAYSFTVTEMPVFVGTSINFNITPGWNENTKWDFGDGTIVNSSGDWISHTYENGGKYTVKLTLENEYGETVFTKNDCVSIIAPESSPSITDYDGNIYNCIKIGDQTWMQENLKVTHYSDGTPIPNITDQTEWKNLNDNNDDKAYCIYNNNTNNELDIYGVLYTYSAATNGESSGNNVQGACPNGWHIPNTTDWEELINIVGGSSIAGKKLKAVGSAWESQNIADNLSEFSALPGGDRSQSVGHFEEVGYLGYFWSSTSNEESTADVCEMKWNLESAILNDFYGAKSHGYSIRCVKD